MRTFAKFAVLVTFSIVAAAPFVPTIQMSLADWRCREAMDDFARQMGTLTEEQARDAMVMACTTTEPKAVRSFIR